MAKRSLNNEEIYEAAEAVLLQEATKPFTLNYWQTAYKLAVVRFTNISRTKKNL
ncbi:hypothetical protein [Geomicrobium sp. JCM 19055]|uniref:hypothetical protein n=1 Tax=Geomicrobium sp. JCM 19055 TaxID=1460649 RepID=UPI00045ED4E9|nr:hypothetical protein [Geomicrobium sp. JCM 19055]GAJ98341.1 hypothetical protein JCM19055_1261 [Geomicrobium sp. JCM 19055]